MALHFVIDGYNLLYALPQIPAGPWQTKRESLLALLERSNLQGNNRISVIFDSRDGGGSRSLKGAIEIIFTAGETADDWIIQAVRKTSNARIMVVVTDDQTLRRLIRGTGAKWLSTREFLEKSKSPPAAQEARRPPPPGAADITEEFKKKWL